MIRVFPSGVTYIRFNFVCTCERTCASVCASVTWVSKDVYDSWCFCCQLFVFVFKRLVQMKGYFAKWAATEKGIVQISTELKVRVLPMIACLFKLEVRFRISIGPSAPRSGSNLMMRPSTSPAKASKCWSRVPDATVCGRQKNSICSAPWTRSANHVSALESECDAGKSGRAGREYATGLMGAWSMPSPESHSSNQDHKAAGADRHCLCDFLI